MHLSNELKPNMIMSKLFFTTKYWLIYYKYIQLVFTFYTYSYQINQHFSDGYENACYGAWHGLGLSMLIAKETDIRKILKSLKTAMALWHEAV
jgi:hypothetical protein